MKEVIWAGSSTLHTVNIFPGFDTQTNSHLLKTKTYRSWRNVDHFCLKNVTEYLLTVDNIALLLVLNGLAVIAILKTQRMKDELL